MENEAPRLKVAEMTPEMRRDYNREKKRISRQKAKQERLASQIPVALDYELPQSQKDQLAENARQITATIAAELPDKLSFEDEIVVEMMSDVMVAHDRKWTKEVHSPSGVLYGNFFPDAAASEIIQHVHRYPRLLESPTFKDLYQRFLALVRKLSRSEWFDPEFTKDIEAELSGTYTLPPKPEIPIAPEPAPVPALPQPPMPSDREILERGRIRLLEQIQAQVDNPQLSPEARNFLYGH
jgi:hypothetical protein